MTIQIREHQSVGHHLAVHVNGKTVQTVNPRTKDWPQHDADPVHCNGYGHATCMRQGKHSWFNHSMDSFYAHPEFSNLPEGYVES